MKTENDAAYYKEQIKGLILILEDYDLKECMVARSYVIEKLEMILRSGINFHPIIKEHLKYIPGEVIKKLVVCPNCKVRISQSLQHFIGDLRGKYYYDCPLYRKKKRLD